MQDYITTWLDVLNFIPQYFDFDEGEFQNTNKGLIFKWLAKAAGDIKSELKPYYGDNLSVGVSRFNSVSLLQNNNPDFIFNSEYITVGTNFTQVYKFEFIDDGLGGQTTTKFNVYPDYGVPVTNQLTTGTANLTYIVVGTGVWTGYSFKPGDIVYLEQYHYEQKLSDLVAMLAAVYILTRTANSQLSGDAPNASSIKSDYESEIKKIKDPFAQYLQIPIKSQNQDSIPLYYDVDEYGVENEDNYIDT